ncbi:MAG: 3-deoxy-D-manno-octulosonic acid transferase [Burkholderiales bacterium]|nr:3-deoxy-D-manno-octulosonic acid transferase [Burkholderiales bacterium]
MIPTFARWTHSALTLLAVPARLAHLWWRGREHRGWRLRWHERLAWGGARAQPGALWLHAQTTGEVQEVAVLVAELRKLNPSWRYLITHGEAEGRADGRALLKPGDVQAWLPFDTPGATGRFFKRHQPRVGVLMERLPRPNLLRRAAHAGVPVMMANARLSAPELQAAQRRRALLAPGFRSLALVLAQSNADAQRLAKAGAQQVRVFGNLKFDVEPPLKLVARGLEWRHAVARPVVLAAGTREGEEDLLLEAWKAMPAPRPLLVIVPRRARRLAQVGFAVREHGFMLRRRSNWSRLPPEEVRRADVWLGDSVGEMAMYYGMADVALLGGSFKPKHGGQNLIEAAACGCPVLMGPHTSEHENVAELAIAAGAAERLPDMRQAVARAVGLAGDPRRDAWVRNAFTFTAAHRGTVNRVVGALLALITTRSSPSRPHRPHQPHQPHRPHQPSLPPGR